MRRANPSLTELVGVGILNGLLIGGGLAMAHRDHWLLMGVAISAFISFTYYLSSRRAA